MLLWSSKTSFAFVLTSKANIKSCTVPSEGSFSAQLLLSLSAARDDAVQARHAGGKMNMG